MTRIALLAAAALTASLAATPALADAAQEASIAATHAGLAAKNGMLNGVQMHLHHALNCLVGENGPGYDKTQANPCAKAGTGAIPDETDPAKKEKLTAAAQQAQDALGQTDLAAAQAGAQKVADTIRSAE
jgi:hypothetical protein